MIRIRKWYYSLFRKNWPADRWVRAVENAIYDAWERLSSDATRSFAVKFPRYAETVVRAWVNRVWPAGVVQIPEFFYGGFLKSGLLKKI